MTQTTNTMNKPVRTQHTPGPWQNNGGQIKAVSGLLLPGYRVIATVGKVNEQTHRDTANARLIAAAPIGFALATAIIKWAPACPLHIVKLAGEFLAKAEGRAE